MAYNHRQITSASEGVCIKEYFDYLDGFNQPPSRTERNLPVLIDTYLSTAARCPAFADALSAFRKDARNAENLTRSIDMLVCILLFHELGHIIDGDFDQPIGKQQELSADTFAVMNVMKTFGQDYKSLMVEGFLLFTQVTNRVFHADAGSPPSTSERTTNFVKAIYDYFLVVGDKQGFEGFHEWNGKNLAAMQKVLGVPDIP